MKVLIIFLLSMLTLTAQPHQPRDRWEIGKRFDELEKLKILEILDMDEETALKFFARRNEMKKRAKAILEKGEKIHSDIDLALRESKGESELQKLVEASLNIEEEIFKERANFISKLDEILNTEQIAKLILFEKQFKRDVRDLLIERGRKRFFNDNRKK